MGPRKKERKNTDDGSRESELTGHSSSCHPRELKRHFHFSLTLSPLIALHCFFFPFFSLIQFVLCSIVNINSGLCLARVQHKAPAPALLKVCLCASLHSLLMLAIPWALFLPGFHTKCQPPTGGREGGRETALPPGDVGQVLRHPSSGGEGRGGTGRGALGRVGHEPP